MIKTIIIDDEKSARNVLANLLERASSDIEIVATCCDLEQGVEQIKKTKPNVVFIDVQMPNYAGYEISKFFDTIDFEIVFVTAYDQYAIKAFELNAIDYLVKPINRNKLALTLEKLANTLTNKAELADYQTLLKTIRNKDFKKIVIPELGNRRVVNLADIIAIEADGAYSAIHLKGNNIITTSKNLKYFEEVLPNGRLFFRSHRAWIVNLEYIELINKTKLSITLADGTILAKIARARIHDFEHIIKL
ncbi:response regulator [Flavobacteriaceae bacterium]|nr:response regulator [Flavobacteriaceae bacterium]